MADSKKRQFAINATSGIVAQAVKTGVGLFSLPYILWRLGPEVYGISQLANSALAFFGFLQLGMGPALIRFCSQAIAQNDHIEIRKISSTAQLILGLLGLVGMLGGTVIIPFFLDFYDISVDLQVATSGLLLCMAVSFFCNMLLIVPLGLLLGSNRYDLSNGLNIVANLFRIGIIIALFELFTPSLLLFGICVLSAQILRCVVLFGFVAKRFGLTVLFSFRSVNKVTFRKLFAVSFLTFLHTIADFWAREGPVLVIGKVLDLEAVALLAPARLVANTIKSFVHQISSPLIPIASSVRAKGNISRIGKWSMVIAQAMVCLGLAMSLPFALFGKNIVILWLGTDMTKSWVLIAWMAFGSAVARGGTANGAMGLGGGSILPTVLSAVVLAIFIPVGISFGTILSHWNLVDIVLFIVVSDCVRSVFYMSFAYSKQFQYSPWRYINVAYFKPIVAFTAIFILGLCFKYFFPTGNDLTLMVGFELFVVLALYFITIWYFVLSLDIKSYLESMFLFFRRP